MLHCFCLALVLQLRVPFIFFGQAYHHRGYRSQLQEMQSLLDHKLQNQWTARLPTTTIPTASSLHQATPDIPLDLLSSNWKDQPLSRLSKLVNGLCWNRLAVPKSFRFQNFQNSDQSDRSAVVHCIAFCELIWWNNYTISYKVLF